MFGATVLILCVRYYLILISRYSKYFVICNFYVMILLLYLNTVGNTFY